MLCDCCCMLCECVCDYIRECNMSPEDVDVLDINEPLLVAPGTQEMMDK